MSTEIDHIEQGAKVIESDRIAEGVAIIWARTDGPRPNSVQVAEDHGITVQRIKTAPGRACYRVEV